MVSWKDRTPEQRAQYTATAKAKRHARAVAAGRMPGQIGTPIRTSAEEKKQKRRLKQIRLMADPEKRAKHYTAKNAARRAKWAACADAVGKVVRKWRYTKEERIESDLKAQRRFRAKHLDKRRKYDAEWKKQLRATPEGRNYLRELARVNSAKRRAQKKGCSGSFTKEDVRQLYFEQRGLCGLCDLPMDAKDFHVDHWKPLSRGGSNDKSNLKLLHPKCNLMKHAKLPSELKIGVL